MCTCMYYSIVSFLTCTHINLLYAGPLLRVLDLLDFQVYLICYELFFKLFARIDFNIYLLCKIDIIMYETKLV